MPRKQSVTRFNAADDAGLRKHSRKTLGLTKLLSREGYPVVSFGSTQNPAFAGFFNQKGFSPSLFVLEFTQMSEDQYEEIHELIKGAGATILDSREYDTGNIRRGERYRVLIDALKLPGDFVG